MKETFSAVVWKEGEWYVAQCREFEVASQGETKEEALKNLAEVLRCICRLRLPQCFLK